MTDAYCIRVTVEGGTDVSGRSLARQLRRGLVRATESVGRVTLDFAGVECASDSFLDELVGVLVAERGKAWFREHVTVVNLRGCLRSDLLSVVNARLAGPVRASQSAAASS